MKSTASRAGQFGLPARIRVRNSFTAVLMLCAIAGTPAAYAKDPCKTVLCMFGRFTGNSGGSECQPAEADYFNIIAKKKKGRIDWNATASARKEFLDSCPQADGGFTKKINDKFGKVGG